jgi:hypothetical protein
VQVAMSSPARKGPVNLLSVFRLEQEAKQAGKLFVDDIIEQSREDGKNGPMLIISPKQVRIIPSQSDSLINGVFDENQALDAEAHATAYAAAIIALNPRIVLSPKRGVEIIPTIKHFDPIEGKDSEAQRQAEFQQQQQDTALTLLSQVQIAFTPNKDEAMESNPDSVQAGTGDSEKPTIHWLSMRNIKWTNEFYDEVFGVLKNGAPKTVKDRNRLARRLNCKRFWEYLQHFALVNDRIALVDHRYPPWLTGPDGTPVAHATLPIVLHVVKQDEIHSYLQKMYSHLCNNAYRSCNAFYKRLSSLTLGISRADVENFVAQQEVSQIQQNVFSKQQGLCVKPLRPVAVMQWWEIDLIDTAKFAGHNHGIHFLLVIIDIFSKFCFVRPLRSKHGKRVAFELQNIFTSEGSPTILQHDNGKVRNRHMHTLHINIGKQRDTKVKRHQ